MSVAHDLMPLQSAQRSQAEADDATLSAAIAFDRIRQNLGFSFSVFDNNFKRLHLTGSVPDLSRLMHSPEFLTRWSQTLFLSSADQSIWIRVKVRYGCFEEITPILGFKYNWGQIVNKKATGFEFLVVGYSSGEGGINSVAVIPSADFVPERITKHFTHLIGETAQDHREIGKLLCFILHEIIDHPPDKMMVFVGHKQGFQQDFQNHASFCPPRNVPLGLMEHLSPSLQCRQYPAKLRAADLDMTNVLAPVFANNFKLQLLLLYRIASWFLFLFSRRSIRADTILMMKTPPQMGTDIPIAFLKNTSYDVLSAVSIGPGIKPLAFELSIVNDGVVVVVDTYRMDQMKKAERGYDLLQNDIHGAVGNSAEVHHILALISNSADMYFPPDSYCTWEGADVIVEASPNHIKNILQHLDANLISCIENSCRVGTIYKVFFDHLDDLMTKLPENLPRTKHNTYLLLATAFRMYNEFFSPLFYDDMDKRIGDWLTSQGQEQEPLHDRICSEYGRILNKMIAEGDFRLVIKEDVTQFDKGSHVIIVDQQKQRVYLETAESMAIAREQMKSISDTDSLTSALYECGYLPHTPKNEKSIRIAAITSDGTPYPLYVHAISYTLFTPENRQRFGLIEKDAFLFRKDEIPSSDCLPLLKTIDGRYVCKLLDFALEEAFHYFGSGRSGSGKSWAVAQILCMLFMLGQNVTVFEVSRTYTREKLCRMLPREVVDRLFCFMSVGKGLGKIPVDLGCLKGCIGLAARKRTIYKILTATVTHFHPDKSKDTQMRHKLKAFLSTYLDNEQEKVNFQDMLNAMKSDKSLDAKVIEAAESVISLITNTGCSESTWDDLFASTNKITVVDFGNESGENTHPLLEITLASLLNWQMEHDNKFLSIAVDELEDQNFSPESPLSTIMKQGRKFHTALLGVTHDYFNQGSAHMDVMKGANIQAFGHPGKSADKVAQKLGFSNAIDAGFHKFRPGDVIMELDALNKDTCVNEAVTLRGRVVDFVDTPLYEKFLREYGQD